VKEEGIRHDRPLPAWTDPVRGWPAGRPSGHARRGLALFVPSTSHLAWPRPWPAQAGEPGRCIRSARTWSSSTPMGPSSAPRPRSQPSSPAWPPMMARAPLTVRPPRPSGACSPTTVPTMLVPDGWETRVRTWSIPARGYWLSGPSNHHGQGIAEVASRPEPRHGVDQGMGGHPAHAASSSQATIPPIGGSHVVEPGAGRLDGRRPTHRAGSPTRRYSRAGTNRGMN
jgi:hypothetical protein